MAKSPTPRSTPAPVAQTARTARPSSADTARGVGDELQQQAGVTHPVLTTQMGIAVPDNQNSLRASSTG